jgi:hypothetical protein
MLSLVPFDYSPRAPESAGLFRVSIGPTVVQWLVRAAGAVRPSRLGEWLR